MRVCHGVSVCSWWYVQCNDWVRYNFLDSFANNKKSPMIKSWCVLSFFFLSVIFHVFVLLPSIQMTEITKSTADTKYNNATIAERFFFVVHDIYRFFYHSLWNACKNKKMHTRFSSFLLTQSFDIDAISIQMAIFNAYASLYTCVQFDDLHNFGALQIAFLQSVQPGFFLCFNFVFMLLFSFLSYSIFGFFLPYSIFHH